MKSRIETFSYPSGEIQRVQVVEWEDFSSLSFCTPKSDTEAFDRLCRLYRDFIIRKYSKLFGKIIIYRLPEDGELPISSFLDEGEEVYDPLSALTLFFRKTIRCRKGKLVFSSPEAEEVFERLKSSGDLFVAEGERNRVSLLPVGRELGFLSRSEGDATLAVNGHFFVMDQLDCGSPFDHVGVPVGLALAEGRIWNPPQFDREALLVDREGKVVVRKVSMKEVSVIIEGREYRDGEGCCFHTRPERRTTPKGGTDVVVVHNEVVAVKTGGKTPIPSGGFVLKLEGATPSIKDRKVSYQGLGNIVFGIQVGNSAIAEGEKTDRFISPFYKFWNLFSVSFPPSMYPMDYRKARAPRIVLGSDREGKPMLLWFEGAGKFGYEKGKGSCGASLSECAGIAEKLGMYNGVHLDGGGSAQILLSGVRSLQISDRRREDFSEVERAVPLGLVVR